VKPGFKWQTGQIPPSKWEARIIAVFVLGAAVAGIAAAYRALDHAGWITHSATVLVTFEKGRPWLEGEMRNCALYPLRPDALLYCEWLVAPPEGESHALPVRFYGQIDRDKALPPVHNNWRCRRQSIGFFQKNALTCWATD
jgi:hypothetical protein